MRVRVLLLLALVGAAFAAAPRSDMRMPTRIVGGEETTIEQHPYMTNIHYLFWGMWWIHWCGGTLLTTRTLLTAANCFLGDENRPSYWHARVGSSFLNRDGTVHDFSQLILHEGYDARTIENDIAIAILATPATFSSSVGVAYIASPAYILADNTPVTVLGWGELWSGGLSPQQLHHVEVNTINHEHCHELYSTWTGLPNVTDNMICAGILEEGGKDACTNDLGGPLIHRSNIDVVIGIISWGYGCADPRFPGVYTRVSQYTDWIVANGSS